MSFMYQKFIFYNFQINFHTNKNLGGNCPPCPPCRPAPDYNHRSIFPCVCHYNLCKKSILYNLHTVLLPIQVRTLPIHLSTLFSLKSRLFFPCLFLFSALLFPLFVNFFNSYLLFLPHRSVSLTCCSFCAPHLKFVYSFVLHFYNQGWLANPPKK